MWVHNTVGDIHGLEFGDIYHHNDDEVCAGDRLPRYWYIAIGIFDQAGWQTMHCLEVTRGVPEVRFTGEGANDICRVTWVP